MVTRGGAGVPSPSMTDSPEILSQKNFHFDKSYIFTYSFFLSFEGIMILIESSEDIYKKTLILFLSCIVMFLTH